jgi:hypothetical protein
MKSLPFLVLMLCASVAFAEPPAPPSTEAQAAAAELVDKQLLAPLKKAESKRARYSRAAPAPVQRRVRVLDTVTRNDVHGRPFVRFAVDERRGWDEKGAWRSDRVLGCAYLNEREVFVQRGDAYLPARSMLGKDAAERSDVCRAAPQAGAQLASARR